MLGRIEDDLGSIFENVKEAALTMQQGGGIGHDFSTLRPKGARVESHRRRRLRPCELHGGVGRHVPHHHVGGRRRGAMMATLRCDHPDIEAFIDAKSDPARLRNFNLSVLVTDAFSPPCATTRRGICVRRQGLPHAAGARAVGAHHARDLRLCRAGRRLHRSRQCRNNLTYCEEIRATNPCGEQPLPPYGACLLGSINLARLVDQAVHAGRAARHAPAGGARAARPCASSTMSSTSRTTRLPRRSKEAMAKRRIGLGVTGLADALIFAGVRYGTPGGGALAGAWMATIQNAAYLASAELAREKGAFPLFDRRALPGGAQRRSAADEPVREAIARHGMRNGCLTSIAPTGTISLLAGNVSSGIEPVFDFRYERRVLARDGSSARGAGRGLRARALPPPVRRRSAADAGLRDGRGAFPARASRDAGGAAARTSTAPSPRPSIARADISFEAFKDVYLEAYDLGLKGCTTYRPNAVTGAVLSRRVGQSRSRQGPPAQGRARQASSVLAPTRRCCPGELRDARARSSTWRSRSSARRCSPGYTYKLKWPGSDHAIYVTINDIERDAGGRRRPLRDLHQHAQPRALRLDGGADAHDQRRLPPRRRRHLRGRGAEGRVRSAGRPLDGRAATCRACSPPSARSSRRTCVRTGFLQATTRALAVEVQHRTSAAAQTGGGGVRRPARIKLCPRCSSR